MSELPPSQDTSTLASREQMELLDAWRRQDRQQLATPIQSEMPQRELSSFSADQVKYIEKLVKFSGRQSKVENIGIHDKPGQKEIVVREFFNFLKVDEQVRWNDLRASFEKGQNRAIFATGSSFLTGCLYFLMNTPTTKSLGLQAVKSAVAATIIGGGFYKYEQALYHRELHSFYILTSDRVKDRRRKQLEQVMN